MGFDLHISELQRLASTTAAMAAAAMLCLSAAHAADASKGKKVLLLEVVHGASLCRDHRESPSANARWRMAWR